MTWTAPIQSEANEVTFEKASAAYRELRSVAKTPPSDYPVLGHLATLAAAPLLQSKATSRRLDRSLLSCRGFLRCTLLLSSSISALTSP